MTNTISADIQDTLNVVVEHKTVVRTIETYIVHTYFNGEKVSHEIMPGEASGKVHADAEVRQAIARGERKGYKVVTSTIET